MFSGPFLHSSENMTSYTKMLAAKSEDSPDIYKNRAGKNAPRQKARPLLMPTPCLHMSGRVRRFAATGICV